MNSIQRLLEKHSGQVLSIAPQDTVFDALQKMADNNVGALVVLEEGQLVGMLSERDYARKVILLGRASKDTRVDEIMTSPVYTIGIEQSLTDAMTLMSEKDIRHLPVMDKGKLAAVISINEVVRAIITTQQETIKFLEDTDFEQ